MSQSYRVELKSSVSRSVQADDRVSRRIELTEILPAAEMKDLLRAELEAAGFAQDEASPGKLSALGEAGEEIVVDLDAMELTASLAEEREVSTEVSARGSAWNRRAARKQAAEELARREAQAHGDLEARGKTLQGEVSRKLEESEPGRMRRMNEILQRVYAESLKRKARRLGDVLEVREGVTPEGEYELVIKVSG